LRSAGLAKGQIGQRVVRAPLVEEGTHRRLVGIGVEVVEGLLFPERRRTGPWQHGEVSAEAVDATPDLDFEGWLREHVDAVVGPIEVTADQPKRLGRLAPNWQRADVDEAELTRGEPARLDEQLEKWGSARTQEAGLLLVPRRQRRC
jgi:hypothetical protein